MTTQVPGDQLNYTALDLTPGTTYTFTVQGCNQSSCRPPVWIAQ